MFPNDNINQHKIHLCMPFCLDLICAYAVISIPLGISFPAFVV